MGNRMTRNRCTALCATLHSETDRGRERVKEGAKEKKTQRHREREKVKGEQERQR